MAEAKKLQRSGDEAIAGVCAGIADRFDVDPLVVRILAVLFAQTFGPFCRYTRSFGLLYPSALTHRFIDCAAYVPAELGLYVSDQAVALELVRVARLPFPLSGFRSTRVAWLEIAVQLRKNLKIAPVKREA
ncbi:MAG: PspC domain-containing protein [Eggerthellaceae bacterium]